MALVICLVAGVVAILLACGRRGLQELQAWLRRRALRTRLAILAAKESLAMARLGSPTNTLASRWVLLLPLGMYACGGPMPDAAWCLQPGGQQQP